MIYFYLEEITLCQKCLWQILLGMASEYPAVYIYIQ